ncbi:UNVERIFIED_CONTAM: hypothetical protein Slati_2477800 [Sesamum latifolium]|uniref:Reverse transcriptase zinc-binding domain-containing protein n=1 Tax=Sesamum latifolium TaxID=2727402 RepID=A0AAW2WE15_9LAMI
MRNAVGGRCVCRFGKGRRFLVKNAYRHAVAVMERGLAYSSGSRSHLAGDRGTLWALLWHTRVPPRVLVFMWRLCVGDFPTLENLAKRK